MLKTVSASAAGLIAVFVTAAAHAQADGPFTNPCAAAPNTDFDFWVGDWVAFDFETGVVQGIDRIHKINNGCSLMQDWSQMTDRFRAPGADFRYAGVSFNSVLPNGDWQQIWVGNYGGTITMIGRLDDEGTMVLKSAAFPTQNGGLAQRTWYWDPKEDGTVHSWGEIRQKQTEDEDWGDPIIPWNLRYVPRADAPELSAAE